MIEDLKKIGELKKMVVLEGDIFVLTTESVLALEQKERLRELWLSKFPNNELVILDRGIKLTIVTPSKNPGDHTL